MNKHLLPILTTALSLLPSIAQAQTYTPSNRTPQADNSIGTTVTNAGANNFNITGGLQRGQNLFHSFSDFSIPTGGAANFTNPVGNQSIITRVTGNLFSDLNGTLNTNGANFLLINPNGVVFGTGVKLDVGKAFVTSTASGVDFVDAAGRNYNFGTNKAGDAPLISIAPNVAFNPARLIMNVSIPGSRGIENHGILQTNNSGQYIGLIGGNVTFNNVAGIKAPGGRVDIGGLNTAGTVSIGNEGLVLAGNSLIRSDLSLNGATINMSADKKSEGINTFFSNTSFPGGSINISGNNVQLDGIELTTGLSENSGIQTAPTGDINIDATGKLALGYGFILNGIESGAEGQLGNININADSLVIKDLFVGSGIYLGGKGRGGNINIKTSGNLTLTNSAIDTSTDGEGDAGQIVINTNGKLFLDRSVLNGQIADSGVGNSKGIKIDAGELELTNQSNISSYTRQSALVNGKGNAGDIDIKTKGNLIIANSVISSTSDGSGNSGKITFNVQGKLLLDFSLVNNSIYSRIVDTNGTVVDNNNFKILNILIPNQQYLQLDLYATSNWPIVRANTSIGNSQTISIKARELEIKNFSDILSETAGNGNAGDIKIGTTGNATISSSRIVTNIARYGEGKTGKISLDVGGKLTLNESSIQSIVAGGTGDSQGIDLKARELNLLDNSGIFSQTSGKGNAGDIRITTLGETILDNSLIYSSSSSLSFSPTETPLSSFFPVPDLKGTKYSSGSIDITSQGLFLNGSNIVSASELVQGGNIKINLSDKLLLRGTKESFSTISTDSGIDNGTVISGDNSGNIKIVAILGQEKVLITNQAGNEPNTRYIRIIIKQDHSAIAKKNDTNPSKLNSFDSGGNGGNITISSPLIIALPGNNDITANAYQGNGGQVKIDSQGLFGIQYRPLGSEFTNDITASSTFGQSGNVNINTPGIDPGKDTGELPAAPNDASNQISQACGASQRENKFYITGRGGLPPNASEPQESEALWQDAREVKTKPTTTASQPPKFVPPAIGWVFQPDGRVRLIAAQTAGGATGTKAVCPGK